MAASATLQYLPKQTTPGGGSLRRRVAMKVGFLEIGDVFIVNKAVCPGAGAPPL